MYVASVVSHSDGDTANFGEVKVLIVHVVVRSDPANPHTRRLLPGEDPHRVIILRTGNSRNWIINTAKQSLFVCAEQLKAPADTRGPASIH